MLFEKTRLYENRERCTFKIIDKSGELHIICTDLPLDTQLIPEYQKFLEESFERNFNADKALMIYRVLNESMMTYGISFYTKFSSLNEERERIGKSIKEMREQIHMEAKTLAKLSNIDAANLCRIEQGKYSVGFDVLSKIAKALGAKVELVKNPQI